jgi:hypothetical protein
MVAETIEIDVHRKGLLSPDNISIVTVTYLFRNQSQRRLTIEMGFPVNCDKEEGYAQASGPDVQRAEAGRVAVREGARRARRPRAARAAGALPHARLVQFSSRIGRSTRREGIPS